MESWHMIRASPALQWVTLGSIVAYLGYNTGGMFVTGEQTPCCTSPLGRDCCICTGFNRNNSCWDRHILVRFQLL